MKDLLGTRQMNTQANKLDTHIKIVPCAVNVWLFHFRFILFLVGYETEQATVKQTKQDNFAYIFRLPVPYVLL